VIKLGRSFWWFLALIVISFSVSRLPRLGENPIYLRLSIALLVVLLFNGIWVAISMIGVTFTRTTQAHRKQVGNLFIEYYELRNQSPIPKIWVKISDQSDLPGESSSCLLTWIGGYRSKTYDAYTRLERSGWFQLGPTMIETGDIFGLFRYQKVMSSREKLLVIPYIVDIPRFPAPFGTLPGGRALRQKTLEVTPYAAGVREYVPGDPLRRIHWPTSARKQKLIVKEFEKDPMETVWMFVDADQSVHFDRTVDQNTKLNELLWLKQQRRFQLPPSTKEYAVTIAASIAKYLTKPHQRADGILTDNPAVTLLMRFADCVPILLFDPIKMVIGIIHAGWQGTLKNIVGVSIEKMADCYGSNPRSLFAGIGPSICQRCYEVGDEVYEAFVQRFGQSGESFFDWYNQSPHLNLWAANRFNLMKAGVTQIEVSGVCTSCYRNLWFSHRGENGKTGRFGVIMRLHDNQ